MPFKTLKILNSYYFLSPAALQINSILFWCKNLGDRMNILLGVTESILQDKRSGPFLYVVSAFITQHKAFSDIRYGHLCPDDDNAGNTYRAPTVALK